MRLLFTPPAGWRTMELARRVVATAMDGGLVLEWSPHLHVPDDPRAWMWRELRRELSAAAILVERGERETCTQSGWPLKLVEVAVVVDGVERELRLAAFYAFHDHVAVAMLRAAASAALEGARSAVENAIREATPRFRDDAGVAIGAFWERVTPATER